MGVKWGGEMVVPRDWSGSNGSEVGRERMEVILVCDLQFGVAGGDKSSRFYLTNMPTEYVKGLPSDLHLSKPFTLLPYIFLWECLGHRVFIVIWF